MFLSTLLCCYWNLRNSFIHSKTDSIEKLVFLFNQLVEEFGCTGEMGRPVGYKVLVGLKQTQMLLLSLVKLPLGLLSETLKETFSFLALKIINCGSTQKWWRSRTGGLSCGLLMLLRLLRKLMRIKTMWGGMLDTVSYKLKR